LLQHNCNIVFFFSAKIEIISITQNLGLVQYCCNLPAIKLCVNSCKTSLQQFHFAYCYNITSVSHPFCMLSVLQRCCCSVHVIAFTLESEHIVQYCSNVAATKLCVHCCIILLQCHINITFYNTTTLWKCCIPSACYQYCNNVAVKHI